VIRIKYGEELRDSLKEIGMEVEWHAYEDGEHWVNEPSGVGEYKDLQDRCQVNRS
jgi:predicted esterase